MNYLYIYLAIGLLTSLHEIRQLKTFFELTYKPEGAFKYFVVIAITTRTLCWPVYLLLRTKWGRIYRIKWHLKMMMKTMKNRRISFDQPERTTEDVARPE